MTICHVRISQRPRRKIQVKERKKKITRLMLYGVYEIVMQR